ncbi:hypothetical protein CPB85DRAFT_1444802 [Mucidula mucida]|nr:hypothetical protein CPB85DRAFT_1444802 [Mucidula mucida]
MAGAASLSNAMSSLSLSSDCIPSWHPDPGREDWQLGMHKLHLIRRGRTPGVSSAEPLVLGFSNCSHESFQSWVLCVADWRDHCRRNQLGPHLCTRWPSFSLPPPNSQAGSTAASQTSSTMQTSSTTQSASATGIQTPAPSPSVPSPPPAAPTPAPASATAPSSSHISPSAFVTPRRVRLHASSSVPSTGSYVPSQPTSTPVMAAGSSLSHILVNGRVSKFFAVSVLEDEVDDILDDDDDDADREVFTSIVDAERRVQELLDMGLRAKIRVGRTLSHVV